MYTWGRISAILTLSMICLCACKAGTQTPAPLNTVNGAQGGKIVYGTVAGATTQGAAMSGMLKTVHNNCGEKPQIGKVFQFTGSNSVGVFFTVTDHPEGNIPLAGMVIAAATGPNQVQAAMIYDYASRFGQTANPLLQQLSSVWNPGAAGTAAAGSQGGASTAPAGGSAAGVPAGMQKFTLPDSTASVSIPAGWTVDPKSGGGGILLHGPQGEVVILGSMFLAQDPNGQAYRNTQRMGMKPLKGMVTYPANADLAKNFAQIVQQLSQSNGFTPVSLNIDNSEQVSPPAGSSFQGERCAQASGQINPDGKGLQAMFRVICATTPDQYGDYSFFDYVGYFPNTGASQANAIAAAIFTSFNVNEALVAQRASAEAAPHIAQLKQVDAQQRAAVQANTARIVGNIQQIGANATARMNATEAANSAEQSSWNAGQNANAQNNQGFNNYLLDQSVVQNNTTGAHTTNWNSAADAMVKSGKYSYVSNSNYIPGTDY